MNDAVDFNYRKYWLENGATYSAIGAYPRKTLRLAQEEAASNTVAVSRAIEMDTRDAIDALAQADNAGDRLASMSRTSLLAPLLDWGPLFDGRFHDAALIGGAAAVLAGLISIGYVAVAGGRVVSLKLNPAGRLLRAHLDQARKAKKLANGEGNYASAMVKEMRLRDLAEDLVHDVDLTLAGLRSPGILRRLATIALIAAAVWFARNAISGGTESTMFDLAADAKSLLANIAVVQDAMLAAAVVGVEVVSSAFRKLILRGRLGAFKRRIAKTAAGSR